MSSSSLSSTSSSAQAPADELLIAFAQMNPVAGDIAGNLRRVREARALAGGQGAELVVFTELFLSGSAPQDLLPSPAFQAACRQAVDELALETADGGPALLVGAPWAEDDRLYNAVLLLDGGAVAATRFKAMPGTESGFDERRVFSPGPMPGPMAFRGVRIGVPVGEDLASPDVAECLMETGAEILIVPAASPYRRDVQDARLNVAVARVVESGLPLAYVNPLGGQDERVFDGGSFVLNADLSLAVQLPNFQERVRITRWERWADGWRCEEGARAPLLAGNEADYAACVLGLRDHVEKNGFAGVVLDLSGGADSALATAMAVDALEPGRVHGVVLGSRDTSPEVVAGAAHVARALGVRSDSLSIDAALEAMEQVLAPLAAGRDGDRLSSGVRGALLRALADRLGACLVATGGAGGFDPLKGLDAGQRHDLAALRNRWKPAGALGPQGPVMADLPPA